VAPFDPDGDPARDARSVAAELKKFDPALHRKARWLVLNKWICSPPRSARPQRQSCAQVALARPELLHIGAHRRGLPRTQFRVMKFLETGKAA